MKKVYSILTLLQLCAVLSVTAQTAGTLDTTFNSTGIFTFDYGFQDNLTDVKIQPLDQKIVVSGTAITPTFSGKLLVARLLPEGGFDSTFNSTGSLIIPNFNESYAYETVIKSDGKILVAGAAADPAFQFSMLVMRLNEDGSLDSTFGTNGMVVPEISTGDDFAYAMAEQPDHKIVLAGTALDVNFNNAPVVVRLMENGEIDSTFGTNGQAYIPPVFIDNELNGIAIQQDGKIVVAGHFDNGLTGSGQFDFDILVARFNSDGTADSTFGINGVVKTGTTVGYVDDAFDLQITPDGNILVAGFTTLANFGFDALLLQYDSTGTLDVNFGNGGIVQYHYGDMNVAFDVEVQNDGNILIAGCAGQFPPNDNNFLLARYSSAGVPDITFGTNGVTITPISPNYEEALGMALQADGKIVLAGKSNNGLQNDIAVARFTNDVSSAMNEVSSLKTFHVYPNPLSKYHSLSVQFEMVKDGAVSVELFDVFGSLVKVLDFGTLNSGIYKKEIQLPAHISSGAYLLKFNGIDQIPVFQKLIVN